MSGEEVDWGKMGGRRDRDGARGDRSGREIMKVGEGEREMRGKSMRNGEEERDG